MKVSDAYLILKQLFYDLLCNCSLFSYTIVLVKQSSFTVGCVYLKMILCGLGEAPDAVGVLDLQVVRY